MEAKHEAKLKKAIDKWLKSICWDYDYYYGEELVQNMAVAAKAVFDQNMNTAKFYEENVVKK